MLNRIVNRLEEGLIALLLAAMTLVTFHEVVLRYVFASGRVWSLESVSYMFAWLVLLGISYGIRVNAHIGIDLVVGALPLAARRVVGLLAVLLCMLYAGLMFWGAWRHVGQMVRLNILSQHIPLPRWLFVTSLPIGFGLLFLRLLQVAVETLLGRRPGLGLADEAGDLLKEKGLLGGEAGEEVVER